MSGDPENQEACPACGYVQPSPESLAKLDAGIESAKTRPLVTGESFAKYADDDAPEQLTTEERERLELLAGDLREVFTEEVAKLLRIHDAQQKALAGLVRSVRAFVPGALLMQYPRLAAAYQAAREAAGVPPENESDEP